MAKKRKFLDFLDMIDGGGAGKMGDEFEGGGLLSAFANMAASPYGSEDETRRKARQDFYSSQNIGGGPQVDSARVSRPVARPAAPVSFADMEGQYSTSPAASVSFADMEGQYSTSPATPVSFADMEGQYSSAPASSYAPAAQTALPPSSALQATGGYAPPTGERSYTEFLNLLGPDVVRTNSPENLVAAYQEYRNSF